MNRDDVFILAREAGMFQPGPLSQERGRFYPHDFAERFAALVAAKVQRNAKAPHCRTCACGFWDEPEA